MSKGSDVCSDQTVQQIVCAILLFTLFKFENLRHAILLLTLFKFENLRHAFYCMKFLWIHLSLDIYTCSLYSALQGPISLKDLN